MKLLVFTPPTDRVAAEAVLLEQLHQQIASHAGVLTVAQVIGILEACKFEIIEQHMQPTNGS